MTDPALPQSPIKNQESKMPSVLGIAASPRRDGNTDLMLREALRGAADAGAQTEFLALRSHKVAPCTGCDRCVANHGRCVVADAAVEIHDKLLAADHVVFASPIFFVAVSAHAKALIDRCQCFWNLKYVLREPLFDPPRPDRKGLFLSCAGSDRPWMFDGARRTIKALFNVLELGYAGEVCHLSIDAKGDAANHPTALAEAYQAGRSLVAE